MLRKNFLLFFLVVNISLPVLFSFANALSKKEVNEESCISSLVKNTEEENSKEDKSEFEKEKSLIFIQFNISPLIKNAIKESMACDDCKILTGNSDCPFSPPKFFRS
jgi:hypothetical protein